MQPVEQAQASRFISGPQLPPLVKGQKIKTGPYTVTVTDEMVAERERENELLYRTWLEQQQRRMLSDENNDYYVGDFKSATVRRVFIRKVFCLLTIQLIFTVAFTAIFMFVSVDCMEYNTIYSLFSTKMGARKFMILHWYFSIIALVFFMISYCAIHYSECARRRLPGNIICLCLLTLAMSYLAAFASVSFATEIIILAGGMTAVITAIIGFSATFFKFDLTMRTGLMAIIGLVGIVSLFVMIIVLMFTSVVILHAMISIIGTLLLSMYLYFDVQTIMGGRRMELDPNEVIFATTQIYVDIVLLYQYVLMFVHYIFGGGY